MMNIDFHHCWWQLPPAPPLFASLHCPLKLILHHSSSLKMASKQECSLLFSPLQLSCNKNNEPTLSDSSRQVWIVSFNDRKKFSSLYSPERFLADNLHAGASTHRQREASLLLTRTTEGEEKRLAGFPFLPFYAIFEIKVNKSDFSSHAHSSHFFVRSILLSRGRDKSPPPSSWRLKEAGGLKSYLMTTYDGHV